MLKSLAFVAWAIACVGATAVQAAAPTQVNQPARATDMGPPTLLVPPSSIGIDLCLGEASGAYGSPMLAITLSTPHRDQDCTDLRLSKWAWDSKHPALAYQIGCASKVWREADAVTEGLCIPQPRPWWRFW